PLQRDHRDLRPDAQPPRKSQKTKTPVHIQIPVLLIGQPRPVQIAIFYRAPPKTVRLYPQLCPMRMTRQGQLYRNFMITDLLLPMRGIVRQTDLESVLSDTRHRLIQIADLYKTPAPILDADQYDLLSALFYHDVIVEQQPVTERLM